MEKSDKYYFESPIKSVEDIFRIFDTSDKYVFRGQKDYLWSLSTTFERAAKEIKSTNWGDLEQKIVLEFKRKAHHYISDIPQSEVEWLALMQHYGTPTRLLDFTRSFLIALYFAVDNTNCDSAVWALDTSYFIERPEPSWKDHLLSTYCKEAEDEVNEIIAKRNNITPGIIFVEPFRQNQRLAIQKGVFAFSKNIQDIFEDNIKKHRSKSVSKNKIFGESSAIIKVKIPQKYHLQIISLLDKMNINSATLFPGLEGYAKSQISHIKMAQLHENKYKWIKLNVESMVSSSCSSTDSSEETSISSKPKRK